MAFARALRNSKYYNTAARNNAILLLFLDKIRKKTPRKKIRHFVKRGAKVSSFYPNNIWTTYTRVRISKVVGRWYFISHYRRRVFVEVEVRIIVFA